MKRLINIRGLQSKPVARDKSLLNNKWSVYYGQLRMLHLNIHVDPLEKGMAPTPVFFPGEFHGQRSLASYSPWGLRVGHDWVTNTISKLKKNISVNLQWEVNKPAVIVRDLITSLSIIRISRQKVIAYIKDLNQLTLPDWD